VIRRFLIAGLVLVALVVVYVGVTFVQVWMASRRDSARPAQAIIVLGAAQYNGRPSAVLKARLDHAAELYEAKIAPTIVLTGGRQPGDAFTEASTGAAYLMRAGIPESALLLESEGTNSWESLAAAAQILLEQGKTEVVLVSSSYHSLRVELIADEVGLDGHASPARAAPDKATFDHLTRETAAVAIGRIIGFHRLVDLDAKVRQGE
jgi:vancomycin permeability regulator SanA